MKNPIVSIIVAVYNTASYLEECIDSLLAQELIDVEIICVNDASTDNSFEIINRYAVRDNRIVVIDLHENVKLGGARNRGIEVARGEYIGFVDSDDYISPKMYSTLIEASEGLTVDIVTPLFYAKHTSRGDTNCYQFSFDLANSRKQEIIDIQREIVKNGCRIWATIFKKQYIKRNNLFFSEKMYYEGFPIAFSFFHLANSIIIAKIKEPLYFYRIDNDSSIMHGTFSKEKFRDRICGGILMYKDAKNIGIDKLFRNEFEYRMYQVFYQNTIRLLLFRTAEYNRNNIRFVYRKYIKMMGAFPRYYFFSKG